MLALTAADIHTKQSEIAITKTYQRIQMKDIISTPKTEKSKRKIPIPKFLLQEILFYIHSKNIKTNQRLFSHTKDYLYYKMKRGCSKTGVRKIRIHDIRDSHVSLLINLGFTPIVIAERVGHEKVSTTLNVYSHLFPSQQEFLVETLENLHKNS